MTLRKPPSIAKPPRTPAFPSCARERPAHWTSPAWGKQEASGRGTCRQCDLQVWWWKRLNAAKKRNNATIKMLQWLPLSCTLNNQWNGNFSIMYILPKQNKIKCFNGQLRGLQALLNSNHHSLPATRIHYPSHFTGEEDEDPKDEVPWSRPTVSKWFRFWTVIHQLPKPLALSQHHTTSLGRVCWTALKSFQGTFLDYHSWTAIHKNLHNYTANENSIIYIFKIFTFLFVFDHTGPQLWHGLLSNCGEWGLLSSCGFS